MEVFCAHGRLIPLCELCQREAAGARLVRAVKLASMRLREWRGGMRRIGETCTAAQTRMRCKDVSTQEYDRNGGGIRRRRRVPVGMPSLASQRPTARVAGSGSAELRLLTCDRRYQHTISAETCAVFGPCERQAPIIHLGDQIGRARGRRGAAEGKVRENDANGQRTHSAPFLGGGIAGGAAPATCRKRVLAEGEGGRARGHACVKSHRTYSLTGPPAGSKSESAETDRWPPTPPMVAIAQLENSKKGGPCHPPGGEGTPSRPVRYSRTHSQ